MTVLPLGAGINTARLLSDNSVHRGPAQPGKRRASDMPGQLARRRRHWSSLRCSAIVLGDVYFGGRKRAAPAAAVHDPEDHADADGQVHPEQLAHARRRDPSRPQQPASDAADALRARLLRRRERLDQDTGYVWRALTASASSRRGAAARAKGNFAPITQTKTTTGAPCPAAAAAKVAVPSTSGLPDVSGLRAPSAK